MLRFLSSNLMHPPREGPPKESNQVEMNLADFVLMLGLNPNRMTFADMAYTERFKFKVYLEIQFKF